MRLARRERRRVRIEMVPLIDTVFLLLVFFIYAMLSMSVHRGIKVDLPRAGNPRAELEQHVVVTINEDGTLFVNREPVSEVELVAAVEEALKSAPSRFVMIDGDKSAELGVGVRVLERLSNIGDIRVAFGVEPEEKP